MKLAECLELGKGCGLDTIDECVLNVEMHATMLFPYSEIKRELEELYEEVKEVRK